MGKGSKLNLFLKFSFSHHHLHVNVAEKWLIIIDVLSIFSATLERHEITTKYRCDCSYLVKNCLKYQYRCKIW